MTRHHQNNIGLSTHSCTRDIQRVESGNNISKTRVQAHRGTTQLQNKHRNNIWRVRSTHGHWEVQQQLQGWKAEVLQLQQVWTHSKGILIKEERRQVTML